MPEAAETTDRALDERERLRKGLLDQLQHLVREVDMLEGVIGRVPQKLLAEAPPDEAHSIKELFALTARLDEAVHAARIRRVAREETPRFAPADPQALLAEEDWRAQPVAEIFGRVRAARQALVGALEALGADDWVRTGLFPKATAGPGGASQKDGAHEEHDLYEMVHALCRQDTARLEGMTRRLYESHLGPQPGANDAGTDDS